MKQKIIGVSLLIFISIVAYVKSSEINQLKEENNNLRMEILLKDKEIEAVKIHNKSENETQLIIDPKARKVITKIYNSDFESLKEDISSNVKIEENRLVFSDGEFLKLEEELNFEIKQLYYSLYNTNNNLKFEVGYELIIENSKENQIIILDFIQENNDWKLNKVSKDH